VDEIQPVATEDAKEMARRIAREEALFAGTSSGANVIAAIHVARRLGPGARVVTLMVDSGLKYLSTDVYGEPCRIKGSRGCRLALCCKPMPEYHH
jgi:cysteine synthase A